jgi:hypothetical protein
MPDQTLQQQRHKRSTGEKIGFATSVGGAVAGPAAIYQSVKSARENQGGMPRGLTWDVTGGDTPNRIGRTRVGQRARGIVTSLNEPKNLKWKTGAKVSGGLAVGLQSLNWIGDAVNAKMNSDKQGKQGGSTVNKSDTGTARMSTPVARRGSGIGFNIAKAGNYDDYDDYNYDRARRSGRAEAAGYTAGAGLLVGGGAAAAKGLSPSGTLPSRASIKQYGSALKANKSRMKHLGGGAGALVLAPVAIAGARRLSDSAKEFWR